MNKKEYHIEENCWITELHNTASDPAVSVARVRVEPGEKTRWHTLDGITERYLILEGAGLAEIEKCSPREVLPGDAVTILPGIPQRITNTGNGDLIFLAVCTPRFEPERYTDVE
jgi:mannose-6-phosphate isomerase-like protein (cupin superfamily)